MKTKYYITLLIAAMGSSLSFGGPISGLDSVYTKGTTTYNGQNADTLNVSTPTTLSLAGSGTWTMAFTISNLQETTENQVGLLFTYNTNHPYQNIEGVGYQWKNNTLTLNVGGFNYNGGTAQTSPWKTQEITNYSSNTPLTLFYEYNNASVTIKAVLGEDVITLNDLAGSGVKFRSDNLTQVNFSAKDTAGDTWSAPNGVTGSYTLNNFDVYTQQLTNEQMKEYAASVVPEPATASLGLLGLGASLLVCRRRA